VNFNVLKYLTLLQKALLMLQAYLDAYEKQLFLIHLSGAIIQKS